VSAPYILIKLKACEGLVQGMSYWTYTDLFEEPGPPTAAFQGGFGLMNRDGIRKPAFFAYKYLHALQGDTLHSNDPQTMMAGQGSSVHAVIWDFKQPRQNVSNRPFYTKLQPATPSAPIVFNVTHLKPNARYYVEIQRTGYEANDAYSAYIKMGLPKDLTAAQIAQLKDLTRDRPEREQIVSSGKNGTVSVAIPMRSNDVVLISLTPVQAKYSVSVQLVMERSGKSYET
jgi:xylan 1,4-beta-xylosidase